MNGKIFSGKELKRIRKKAGKTQGEFAEILGYKTYQTISDFECERRIIPKAICELIKFRFTNTN